MAARRRLILVDLSEIGFFIRLDFCSFGLERPLSPGGRLNGHIVQGHVDGTGEFLPLDSLGEDNWWLRIRIPEELDPYLVYKGSIAVDGISLTVASIARSVLSATIIPHNIRN